MRRGEDQIIERMTAIITSSDSRSVGTRSAPKRVVAQPRLFTSALKSGHLRALGAVLVGALGLSIGYFLLSTPREEILPSNSARAAVEPNSVITSEGPHVLRQSGTEVFVDVAGEVQHPGVFSLPVGSRVIDAITAAGGVVPGTDTRSINLARILEDGEQVLVGASAPSAPGLLNLNTASASELDRLPGIGPVIAARIIAWREAHGRFRKLDQLMDVPGVGAALFASLRTLIAVQ